MPFTPYHFGPGMLAKSVLSRYFSFGMFVGAQILIDLEALFFMLSGQYPVHRFFHTYLGANVVALLLVVPGRWCYEKAGRLIGRNVRVSVKTALIPGLISGYSHVFLDSVMHADVRPWAPWSDANPLYQAISLGVLHWGCLAAGLVGVLWFVLRRIYRPRSG